MKIGFIGCGNMGTAMIKGILESGMLQPSELMASALSMATRQKIKNELKIQLADTNQAVVEFADIVFLAVKPQYYEQVITEIRDTADERQIFVSIAPGRTLEWLDGMFGKPVKLVRTMPNTPAMVKEGMTAYCVGEQVTEQEKQEIARICGCFGQAEEVGEPLMDVVTAVSGSSPAYVFLLIEAMADAAVLDGMPGEGPDIIVLDGMPRDKAYKFASQAVLGSAKMVLQTGMHPGELKDMVCSPGGTTIEAVRVLEEKGLRSSIFEAMGACVKKSKGM